MRRQRGSVAMVAAIALGLTLAALGAIDVGNVYFVRRELQRTADMSAMAAAQVIGSQGGCTAAQSTAFSNASSNGFNADGQTYTLSPTCGRWDTSSKTYFGSNNSNGNPLNAVQVQVTQKLPMFFLVGSPINVTATSTAMATNIDSFSLGTAVATLNTQQSALLDAILGGLLKSSVSLSVADTQSLASANIKLDDLRAALGAASMQGLLNTNVSFHDLMVAMVKALQAGGDTVNANILQALEVVVPGGQNITIGDGGTTAPGLLALGLANPNSAATATINAFDALMVAAQLSQSNPDGTPGPVLNVSAGLPGIAAVSLQVVNPPVLAMGEGGTISPGVYRTEARTAAINLSLTLQPLPTLYLGIATISVLSTPVVVTLQVAPGKADLSSVDCESTKAATQATILATPGIASVCVAGDAACTQSANVASATTILTGPNPVISVKLKRLGFLSLSPPQPTTLVFNGSSGSFNGVQGADSNAVGSDLASLTGTLFSQLPGALSIYLLDPTLSALIGYILDPVLALVTTTLSPVLSSVFSLLDTLIVPTLTLLGVQLGAATVHNTSLTCGVPQLVQ
ncbi:hypothetical protein F3J19_09600 [Burkholderia sp. Ax-1724]|nr:hypothetical protein [Burkholderia sp. Ax-1724]